MGWIELELLGLSASLLVDRVQSNPHQDVDPFESPGPGQPLGRIKAASNTLPLLETVQFNIFDWEEDSAKQKTYPLT